VTVTQTNKREGNNMMTPAESYERQCDWSEGWDAAEKHYEQRLDKMAEEYAALLKDARASDKRAADTIRRLDARAGIFERMIEDIRETIA
jgi:hypothetical protein